MAREITLANEIVHMSRNGVMDENLTRSLRQSIRTAERFVLSDKAAVKVGEAIASYPEMLVEHGQFARPPFDVCWIEFPSKNFHNAVVPGSDLAFNETSDVRVGYLFVHNTVYVVARSGDSTADFSPFVYDINTPSNYQAELDLTQRLGVSRLSLDQLYWGSAMTQRLGRETIRSFRAQHSIRYAANPMYSERIRERGLGPEMLNGCAGEMRNIIGLLLMMNQPKLINYVGQRPNYRALTHRGTKLFLGHREIEIDLDRQPITVILGNPKGTHASPRQHNVIGNYGHRNRAPHCEHYWIADDENHWHCQNCPGTRWWRKGHKRGDPSRGVITQERHLVFDGE